MKKLLLALMAVSLTAPAFAGDLINKDSSKYDYKLSCGAGTVSTSIGGRTTQSGKVSKGCVIQLGGTKYTVKGSGSVTIKGGALSE